MERITAEESMRAVTRISVGSGLLKPNALREVRAAWLRAAGATSSHRVTPAMASAIGIGVTLVPKKGDARG